MGRRVAVACVLALLLSATVWANEEGLVAHYTFDEGSGSTAHDLSGNKNHGKILGARFVKHGEGYALKFDGVDDEVDCGRTASLNIHGPISVEAWVYAEGLPAERTGIVGKAGEVYVLSVDKKGLYWGINDMSDSLGRSNTCGPAPLTLNTWHHVVGTYDRVTMKVYVDGREAVVRGSKRAGVSTGYVFRLGTLHRDLYFKGKLDEVKVYERTLSGEEVMQRAKAPIPTRTVPAKDDWVPEPKEQKGAVNLAEGLVGHYTFGEGSETVLRDESGKQNDGKTQGTKLVKGAGGTALYFEKGDSVSFGSPEGFAFTDAVTLAARIYLTSIAKGDHSRIAGRTIRAFGLFWHVNSPHALFWATGLGKDYAGNLIGRNRWFHIAGSFDGKTVKMYVDGMLRKTTVTLRDKVDNSGNFAIGGYNFEGIISELRVYNRALTDAEVASISEDTSGPTEEEVRVFLKKQKPEPTYELRASAWALYFAKRVDVTVDLHEFAKLPADARVKVELWKDGGREALAEKMLQDPPVGDEINTTFEELDLASGKYEIRARVVDAEKTRIGTSAVDTFTWAAMPSWPKQTAEMKILNNFVTELLNVNSPNDGYYEFMNPRDTNLGGGWVFFSSTVDAPASGDRIQIYIDSIDREAPIIVHEKDKEAIQEWMHLLPTGKHRIRIEGEGNAGLKNFTIRSIPEMGFTYYARYSILSPHPYDWEWLGKHDILKNINMLIGHSVGKPALKERRVWSKMGKKWFTELQFPGTHVLLEKRNTITPEEAYEYWTNNRYWQDRFCSGMFINEFGGGSEVQLKAWKGAIKMIRENFPDRCVYPHLSGTAYGSGGFIPFLMELGYAFSWERYFPEAPTEYWAREFLHKELKAKTQKWRAEVPGSVKHMFVLFGHYMSNPPTLNTNTNPGVDFKVYMDFQFNLLANDPDFFGMYGIGEFQSRYADEEIIRWSAKLFRHYLIEGKTSMLSDTPYVLTHIRNPDFDDGRGGWTLSGAEKDSIAVKGYDGYGSEQGRYYGHGGLPPDHGNYFLWTKRSKLGPNRCSQEIRNLEPGRVYALKAITGDYQDFLKRDSKGKKFAVKFEIEGAEVLPERSLQKMMIHHVFKGDLRCRMNYHLVVFRAKSERARLVISDWASDTTPGGPIGQEIMYNYLELQPFFLEE